MGNYIHYSILCALYIRSINLLVLFVNNRHQTTSARDLTSSLRKNLFGGETMVGNLSISCSSGCLGILWYIWQTFFSTHSVWLQVVRLKRNQYYTIRVWLKALHLFSRRGKIYSKRCQHPVKCNDVLLLFQSFPSPLLRRHTKDREITGLKMQAHGANIRVCWCNRPTMPV